MHPRSPRGKPDREGRRELREKTHQRAVHRMHDEHRVRVERIGRTSSLAALRGVTKPEQKKKTVRFKKRRSSGVTCWGSRGVTYWGKEWVREWETWVRVGDMGERVGDGFFSNIFLNLELGGEIEISRAVGLCEGICRVEYDAKRMRTRDALKTQE